MEDDDETKPTVTPTVGDAVKKEEAEEDKKGPVSRTYLFLFHCCCLKMSYCLFMPRLSGLF